MINMAAEARRLAELAAKAERECGLPDAEVSLWLQADGSDDGKSSYQYICYINVPRGDMKLACEDTAEEAVAQMLAWAAGQKAAGAA